MTPKLSIITAIHNALPMNRFYWKALSENTETPFELIVIDNHSTDGSQDFFKNLTLQKKEAFEVIYVRNEFNQSYPASQNQGMARARAEVLCFMNNDVWMPRGWEKPLIKQFENYPLGVFSPSCQEAQPNQRASDRLKRRWKRCAWLSRIWANTFRKTEEERLWKSVEWMYGSLSAFESPTPLNERGVVDGINGSAVLFQKKFLECVPNVWDTRFQAADWHLYLTMASHIEQGHYAQLPKIVLSSYVHHFGRYSCRQGYEPIRDSHKLLSIDQHWGKEAIQRLWWGYKLPR